MNVKVVFLYLVEAHAADSWPLSLHAPSSHKSMEERIQVASKFLCQHPKLSALVDEWYVDNLDDATTRANGLWPERYALLEGSAVLWASSLAFEDRYMDIPQALRSAANTVWPVQSETAGGLTS